MEFEVNAFSSRIRELFFDSPMFPIMTGDYVDKYGRTQSDSKKHKDRNPTHLKEAAQQEVARTVVTQPNLVTFDYGSERLEQIYPYYHILQQAPVIRKKNRGTAKSKGSEETKKPTERDYERVNWNGKTFTKEYSRNVRGSRINLSKTTMHLNGQYLNIEANQYLNIHYKYIDRILDSIAPQLASEFGLKLKRKQDTGLAEEYSMQEESEYTTDIIDIFNSFE